MPWISIGTKHVRVGTRGVSAGAGPIRVGTGWGGGGSGSNIVGFLCLCVLVGIVALPIWGILAAYHAVFGPHVKSGPQPETRVIGHVPHEALLADSDRIAGVDNVWCQWNGSHVQIHLTILGSGSNPTRLQITPHYKIGQRDHGESAFASSRIVMLHRGSNEVLIDAGDPEGVGGQPRISQCSPRLISAYEDLP